jgi:hypothetical protein
MGTSTPPQLIRQMEKEGEMNEGDIKSFLDENRESILAEVKRRTIDGLLETHRWSISDAIAKEVNAFVEAEVVPEVRKYLQSEKSAIVSAAISGASLIGDEIAKGLAMQASKNLQSDGYRFRKVMSALFEN